MKKTSEEVKVLVLDMVRDIILEDPTFTSRVIDRATASIKLFANKQSDKTTHYAAILSQVVDNAVTKNGAEILNSKNKNSGFSKDQVIAVLEDHFKDTEYFKKLAEKTNYIRPVKLGGIMNY